MMDKEDRIFDAETGRDVTLFVTNLRNTKSGLQYQSWHGDWRHCEIKTVEVFRK